MLRGVAMVSWLSRAQGFVADAGNAWRRMASVAGAVQLEDVLAAPKWPAEWPFTERDFARSDEMPDAFFYQTPRFCFHVDDQAVAALTDYYSTALREFDQPAILDMCASHVSHFPADIGSFAGRRMALGMNEAELKENKQVDTYVVHDLNADPTLPFADDSFDVVTNVVSIDYLSRPREICDEVARVLRPGGVAIFALSNRCFPSKAVDIWLRTNDFEHAFIVGAYFHYTGKFKAPEALEISPNKDKVPWCGGQSQNVAYMGIVRATVDK